MDLDVLVLAERLDLDRVARNLWGAAVPHLGAAVRGEDAGLLAALEGVARSAALSGSAPVAALLDAYNEGCTQLCHLLEATDEAEAGDACLRLRALDRAAPARIATGFCSGLEETVERLRRAADDRTPLDPETGALKPRELVARLTVEAERCRRTDGPLGLVAFGLVPRTAAAAKPRAASEMARRLLGGVRRYDSLGLTDSGDFVVIMPDVSRRGLTAAAERLRREVGRPRGHAPAPEVVCTFFHYDEVDAEPPVMLAALERGLGESRVARAAS